MDKSIVPVNQIDIHSSSSYEFSNPNEAQVVELEDDHVALVENGKSDNTIEIVERQINGLKLDHQFKEENVPQFFKTLISQKMSNLMKIRISFYCQYGYCEMRVDKIQIMWEKTENGWLINYECGEETIKTDDPEKSMIDHLWFVLKHLNIKLQSLTTENFARSIEKENSPIDSEKFDQLLKSMLESIDHQIHITIFHCSEINESTISTILKHIQPGTLEGIRFSKISWKEEGNYEEMKRIVETEQWKQAKEIWSFEVSSLSIDDVLHCRSFILKCDSVTTKDVLRVLKKLVDSTTFGLCTLKSLNLSVDLNEIKEFLSSKSLKEREVKTYCKDQIVHIFEIPNSQDSLSVNVSEHCVSMMRDDLI